MCEAISRKILICWLKTILMKVHPDLKSRHKLFRDKINARIQKVMDHGQFILGGSSRT